ncbi:MAG: UDP-N-acetylmuramoyl-tripeptide--D-alanyl-D-alanine ligase [Clostridia bacterium]|nr:UDP-N-acetylmuramoyl-tripeptide--D-alanyl-D-alanine ligase [Clostridia bacterium]
MDMLLMYWLPCLCMIAGMVMAARRLTHYFQLESYQFHGYFQTVNRQWRRAIAPYLALSGIYLGIFLLSLFLAVILWMSDDHASWTAPQVIWVLLCCAGYVLAGWFIRKWGMKRSEKKKFALTARMKRLYGALIVTLLLIPALVSLIWGDVHILGALCCVIAALLLPWLVALAGLLALPVERLIFRLYFKDAEKKLMENPKLIRIGITGSYGKTSTKFILAEILGQKYNVLATPASFNTPMGVTRIIRERLTPAHQVFIGEMGARHVGEIRELSGLVHPQIGVLTAVGPQHLDTFKTLERIKNTKYELIDALPGDGLGVFLHDGDIVTGLYEKTQKPKMLVGREGSDAWATDESVSPAGSRFTLHLKGWEPFDCETQLLGEHNIRNILTASAVAKYLGLSREQIRRGIQSCKPVEHRLQLLKTPGGVTVIDDAFNTNPRSSKEALKVLSSFPGRRVIVTPGMVELGAQEEKYNEEFGQAMAEAVDVAVLVGRKHTEPIYRGLKDQGFDESSIHAVASLNEAIAVVNGLLRPGDVVMYENDLPDNYSES